jgi:hypothetical protein
MASEKCFVWVKPLWHFQRLALVTREVVTNVLIGEMILEAFAQDHPVIVIEGDQALVEGAIMKAGKTQSIARIDTLFRVTRPGQDVAGNQQFSDWVAGDAATRLIR